MIELHLQPLVVSNIWGAVHIRVYFTFIPLFFNPMEERMNVQHLWYGLHSWLTIVG